MTNSDEQTIVTRIVVPEDASAIGPEQIACFEGAVPPEWMETTST